MAKQLISYDLTKPGRDYERLFDAIKAIGNWWHCLDSVWIVVTELSSAQVRDRLVAHMDANDKLAVFKLQGDWATRNLANNCNEWLQKNM